MKDALASTTWEELGGSDWAEWSWAPHDFHYSRMRGLAGYK